MRTGRPDRRGAQGDHYREALLLWAGDFTLPDKLMAARVH